MYMYIYTSIHIYIYTLKKLVRFQNRSKKHWKKLVQFTKRGQQKQWKSWSDFMHIAWTVGHMYVRTPWPRRHLVFGDSSKQETPYNLAALQITTFDIDPDPNACSRNTRAHPMLLGNCSVSSCRMTKARLPWGRAMKPTGPRPQSMHSEIALLHSHNEIALLQSHSEIAILQSHTLTGRHSTPRAVLVFPSTAPSAKWRPWLLRGCPHRLPQQCSNHV